MLKRPSISRLFSAAKAGLLASVLLASASTAPLAAPICKPLLMGEYCFEGTIKDLLPLTEMEQAFSQEAEKQKMKRARSSMLPQSQQEWLDREWKAATASAYDYARNHTLRYNGVLTKQNFPIGNNELSLFGQMFLQGPLFRLTFAPDETGAFYLSKPVEFNKKRFSAALSNIIVHLPPQIQLYAKSLSSMMSSTSEDEYVNANTFYDNPLAKIFMIQLTRGRSLTDVQKALLERIGLGLFGVEAVMIFYMQFDLRLLERNEKLDHKIYLYSLEKSKSTRISSPQVTFNGELLIPDTIFNDFTKAEIKLILKHEATHLAKPNFFTVLSAADAVIANRFPEIKPDQASTFLSNLLGRPNLQIADTNCPLNLPDDDEMLTDYYVLAQYRNDPVKMDAYQALLKKLQKMRGAGSLSRLAFRSKQTVLARQDLERMRNNPVLESRYNEALSEAMQNFIKSTLVTKRSVNDLRLDDMLDHMLTYPELALDAKRMRILIQYYRTFGRLQGDQVVQNKTIGLSCDAISDMLILPGME